MIPIKTALSAFNVPGVEINSLVESQAKNVEALSTANMQILAELQTVPSRQGETLRETMVEGFTAVATLSGAGSPTEMAANQAELLYGAIDRTVANMRETA